MNFPELPKSFEELIEAAKSLVPRAVSEETLTVLRESSPDNPRVRERLEKLRNGQALAILSGQQLGLFLGPSLTFYKAASLVALSAAVSEALGREVVPIFWLQADDHDYEEIRSINLPSEESPGIRLELPKENFQEQRVSVGRRVIPNAIQELLSALEHYSGADLSSLSGIYKPGRTFLDAFSSFLSNSFEHEGLLLYNPLHPLAKQEAAPLFLRAFREREKIEDALSSRTAALVSAGEKEQVHVRESSPLFFVHDPNIPSGFGGRFRIQEKNGKWQAIGGSFTFHSDEVERLIMESPSAISPSAHLRPLLQDSLFPTLAYIGGDAEVRYLLQLTSVYSSLGVSFPRLVRRMSGTVIEPKGRRLLKALSTSAEEFLFSRDVLEKRLRGDHLSPEELSGKFRSASDTLTNILRQDALSVGGDMQRSVSRAEDKIRRALSGVLSRYSHTLEHRSNADLSRYRKLSNLLTPASQPQERSIGHISYWLKYGESFKTSVLSGAAAWTRRLDGKPQVFHLGE